MMGAILATLPEATAVADKLIAQYGAERLWQVERLSKHIFRAWLTDGRLALAIVQEDGSLDVRELEEVG